MNHLTLTVTCTPLDDRDVLRTTILLQQAVQELREDGVQVTDAQAELCQSRPAPEPAEGTRTR